MDYDAIWVNERLILRLPRMGDAQPIRDIVARDSNYLGK